MSRELRLTSEQLALLGDLLVILGELLYLLLWLGLLLLGWQWLAQPLIGISPLRAVGLWLLLHHALQPLLRPQRSLGVRCLLLLPITLTVIALAVT